MFRVLTLAAVTLGLVAPPASAGTFDHLFPDLPAFVTPTPDQLEGLALSQVDPNADSENNCERPAISGPTCKTSGKTYFGQFVDHDITKDLAPSPTAPVDVTTLVNARTFALDLDSVYAGGPAVSPQLYEADGLHFRTQDPNPNGVPDLPRDPDGRAILVEGRNDENQVISQIHNAFLRAHNRLIDLGLPFDQAQRELTLTYQLAVLNDFLPSIVGLVPDTKGAKKMAQDVKQATPERTMVEFSVAAYRLHTMVRLAYVVNDEDPVDGQNKVQVFNAAGNDLRGGRQLGADRLIIWGYFFSGLEQSDETANVNVSRRIDVLLSRSLFNLPIPLVASRANLAFLNLLRSQFYGLPSGQAVATQLGVEPISPEQLNLGPGFETGTPLWYYIGAESQATTDGRALGPVGSAIVSAVFHSILERDQSSVLRANKNFVPRADIAGPDGLVQISDIFVFAGLTQRAEASPATTRDGDPLGLDAVG